MDAVRPHPKPEEGPHTRGCPCRPCIGRRSRRKGKEAQRRVLKRLAEAEGTQARFWSQFSHEESASLARWQVEVKKGRSIPVFLARAFAQARSARAIGTGRKVLVVLEPEGTREAIACLSLVDLLELADAAHRYWRTDDR